MRKSIFISIFLISFLLLTSIVSAQLFKVPLDIISNFFNSILKFFRATTTSEKVIPSSGTIVYPPPIDVQVTIDPHTVIGKNKLSLAAQLAATNTVYFTDYSTKSSSYHNFAKNANFKLFRVHDKDIGWNYGATGNPTWGGMYHPCRYWDESDYSRSVWDWQYVDAVVEEIFEVDAEPLIALGFVCSGPTWILPVGMSLNPTTGLPNPESFAAYCREWVRHFKQKGYTVKYYELVNEAWFYFNPPGYFDQTKSGYFLQLFNKAYDEMKAENSQILIGNDAALRRNFLEYWKKHGGKLDTLNTHKYDSWNLEESDAKGLERVERKYFDPNYDNFYLTPSQAKQIFGKDLPVIFTETNWGATWEGGTDPRIQQAVGVVWTALMLRGSILNDVDYTVYFSWASSKSYLQSQGKTGYGFGMINSDDNQPWYPYYVHKWVGTNLAAGDSIVDSSSSSSDIRSLAWINNGKLNILLVHKSTEQTTLRLQGVTGRLTYSKIDDPTGTNYLDPQVQTGSINAGDLITFNGYTVMLLQQPVYWYGVGLDYKLVINRDVSITEALNSWPSYINEIKDLGLNTVRLAMAFPNSGGTTHSKLVYSELDQVIELLAQNEIYVIIDLHNWEDMRGYMGSQSWIDSWTDFAEYYKDNDRILAYELFNEPSTFTWHSSITGDGAGKYDGSNGMAKALAKCVDAIRATGDNHLIVYPDPWYWLSYDDAFGHPENWVNSQYYRDNIVITFHQYAPNQDTIDELDAYLPDRKSRVTLWSQYCPVWLGEFGMVRKGHEVEVEYCIRWINFALESGFGFNYWLHGYTSSDQAWQYCTQVLQSSDF